MPPAAAIAGSAVLGTAGSIYAGNRAASAQRQAAGQAADSSLQASREANQLQQQMYNQNRQDMAPWRAAGGQALGMMQGFMGMPSTAAPTQTSPAPQNAFSAPTGVNTGGSGGAMQGGSMRPQAAPISPQAMGDLNSNQPVNTRGPMPNVPSYAMPRGMMQAQQQPQQAPQQAAPAEQVSPQSSFDAFRNSINYNFTRQQGENALQRLLSRQGQVNSGRGMTAALDYGQNMAHSNAIMPYMNQLNNMAGLGQNATMAGGQQGMNMANQMGSNIMGAGNVAANAQMNAGNAQASAYQNQGNAFGNLINQGAQIYGMHRAGGFSPQQPPPTPIGTMWSAQGGYRPWGP